MWWKIATSIHRALKPAGSYEERLIKSCAERLVRRRILGGRMVDPERWEVDRYVERVMRAMRQEIGNLNYARLQAKGDSIEPVVARFVDQLDIG
jgi:hypothetical protein